MALLPGREIAGKTFASAIEIVDGIAKVSLESRGGL
jgi:hypothetical protein